MIKNHTLINEVCRKVLGISRDEYALCQFAHYRAADPRQKKAGWCCDRKEDIADFVGITRAGLYKMLDKVSMLELLEIDAVTGFFRITPRFIDTENAAEKETKRVNKVDTLKNERVNKLDTDCKQSLHDGVNKVTVNIEGIDRVKKERGITRDEKTPLPAPAAENQFSSLEAFSSLNKESFDAGPRHSDKPQNLETHTDLVKQIGEYYKANPREWIDSVKAMSGPMYSNEQLKGMLVDYCSHCFSSRNPYQKFSQHNGDFCRWVKNQKQFERTPAATPEKQADVTRFYNQIPVTK